MKPLIIILSLIVIGGSCFLGGYEMARIPNADEHIRTLEYARWNHEKYLTAGNSFNEEWDRYWVGEYTKIIEDLK